jgi:nonsense-mediated mRNA decay protein 3
VWARAEATVAKRSDLGSNDVTYTTSTHLGNLLKVGDLVWGYMVAASALAGEVGVDESALLPDVLLVKKSYSERRRR